MSELKTSSQRALVVELERDAVSCLDYMREQTKLHGRIAGWGWFVHLAGRASETVGDVYPVERLAGLIGRYLTADKPTQRHRLSMDDMGQFAEMAHAEADGRGWIAGVGDRCALGFGLEPALREAVESIRK